MPFGITVAGGCNGSASTNQTLLNDPSGIAVGFNNTFYVTDTTDRLFVFDLNNRTGRVLTTFSSWPALLFFDNRTSNIYATIYSINLVYIWPTNQTIPPSGISYSSCSMNWVYTPMGITVDSVGNVYISNLYCNWVTKWAPNATNSTIVAGSPTGSSGSNSLSLYQPYGLALDESNSFLYVVDRYNNRIQRFVLGGSGIGVTVAGGNGQGSAANQLSNPAGICLSRLDGSLYIADDSNSRIQKWVQNATSGTTVAGSPNGILGQMPYLLWSPFGIAIDDEENYLYVSDGLNNRIQRFSLH
jgi:DNA-binding beta-propeller fold protein YncE